MSVLCRYQTEEEKRKRGREEEKQRQGKKDIWKEERKGFIKNDKKYNKIYIYHKIKNYKKSIAEDFTIKISIKKDAVKCFRKYDNNKNSKEPLRGS